MTELTPREIVSELDRFIIGQREAKRAVAVALRNRWRRKQLDAELRDEVTPKNILMIGPTGVGKTEISRRLARLANAPFLKVEATKFTEVGYVGRDVEQIVRDLVETAIVMVRGARREELKAQAHRAAEDRVIEALVGKTASDTTREAFRRKLGGGELDTTEVEIEIADTSNPMPFLDMPGMPGQQGMASLGDIFGKAFSGRTRRRKMTVAQSYEILIAEEADKMIDQEAITREAVEAVESNGIVFIDEIDKVARRAEATGADVSREGVQRDLLPLVEGSTVSTRYGMVRTDHILFIASGAFSVAKPSDLIPELQGRFPIRVELSALGIDEFVAILTEPSASLTEQYASLLRTERVDLRFDASGIRRIAEVAFEVNSRSENIGARRLHTVLERLLETISFEAADRAGETVTVDAAYVEAHLGELVKDEDLTRYIL